MPEPAFREMQRKSRNVLKQFRRAKPSPFYPAISLERF